VSLYDDVFAALDAADVRYVVVGGVAVVLHGHVRSTVDLDLVIDLAEEPARRAMQALTGIGLVPRAPVAATEFADEAKRRDWADNKNMQVFSFVDPGDPRREVDVFVRYPVDLEELVAAAETTTVAGRSVRFASVRHLIAMKQTAGRPQDLADIDALQNLEGGRAGA
jgi:hypothetical protein